MQNDRDRNERERMMRERESQMQTMERSRTERGEIGRRDSEIDERERSDEAVRGDVGAGE